MTFEEYFLQERGIRPDVHYNDGIWWRRTALGTCQPIYELQEIPLGVAKPSRFKSFLRYSHILPRYTNWKHMKIRLLLEGDRLRQYGLHALDRKRRQAINRAVRRGIRVEGISKDDRHLADLYEIYISTAKRNRYGLPVQWYLTHKDEWRSRIMEEMSLSNREWLGAFCEDKLVAFLYSCVVGDTAVMLVNKSNHDYLAHDPNDLLFFNAITHYQNTEGCRRVDAGWKIRSPPSIDWRKISLGFEPTQIPFFHRTNIALVLLLKLLVLILRSPNTPDDHEDRRGFLFKLRNIAENLK